MEFFKFDHSKFENSPPPQADLIIRTTRKLASYYQTKALAMLFNVKAPHQPDFNAQEKKLAASFWERPDNFQIPSSKAGRAAFKLFFATQSDFYTRYPDLLAVFGPNGRIFPHVMAFYRSALPKTYEAIDEYFADATKRYSTAAKNYYRTIDQRNDHKRLPPYRFGNDKGPSL